MSSCKPESIAFYDSLRMERADYLPEIVNKEGDFLVEEISILLLESEGVVSLLLCVFLHLKEDFVQTVEVTS